MSSRTRAERSLEIATLIMRLGELLAGPSVDATALFAWQAILARNAERYARARRQHDEAASTLDSEAWRVLRRLAELDAVFGAPPPTEAA